MNACHIAPANSPGTIVVGASRVRRAASTPMRAARRPRTGHRVRPVRRPLRARRLGAAAEHGPHRPADDAALDRHVDVRWLRERRDRALPRGASVRDARRGLRVPPQLGARGRGSRPHADGGNAVRGTRVFRANEGAGAATEALGEPRTTNDKGARTARTAKALVGADRVERGPLGTPGPSLRSGLCCQAGSQSRTATVSLASMRFTNSIAR